MSQLPFLSRQAVSIQVFPMPPERAGGLVDFSCVFTRAGMSRVRLEPSHFMLNLERLKRALDTPVTLVQGPRSLFLDGHTRTCQTYADLTAAANEFQTAVALHLHMRCHVYMPEIDSRFLQAA